MQAKKQANQTALDEDSYTQLKDLEVSRNDIRKESAEFLKCQVERKRGEKEHAQRIRRIENDGKLRKGRPAEE